MAALLQQLCSAAFNQQTFKAQLQNSDKLVEHEGQESQQQQEQERKTCGKWGDSSVCGAPEMHRKRKNALNV